MDTLNGTSTAKQKRKDLRKRIASKLETSLSDLRGDLKEKKFRAAIKRASKLLANDLYVKAKKNKSKETNDITIIEEVGA